MDARVYTVRTMYAQYASPKDNNVAGPELEADRLCSTMSFWHKSITMEPADTNLI